MRDYCYINPVRVDSYFSQINGSLIQEKKSRVEKGAKGMGNVGIEIGSILSKLGLGKAHGNTELSADYNHISEMTTSLTVENKVKVILEYHKNRGVLSSINLGEVSIPNVIKTHIGNAELNVFRGGFKAIIPNATKDEIKDAYVKAFHYCARIRTGRDLNGLEIERHEGLIVSGNLEESSGLPLVEVPIVFENLTLNQLFFHLVGNIIQMEVIGNAITAENRFVLNPLAISFEYNRA
jgi:hypothetical protein